METKDVAMTDDEKMYDRELYRKKKYRVCVNLGEEKRKKFQEWLKDRNVTAQKVLEDYVDLLIGYKGD
ncbi:MAG: hypothetical protein ACRC7R_04995 [Sarcina sp.]